LVEPVDLPLPDSEPTFRDHWFPGAAAVLRTYSAAQQAQMDPGLVEVATLGERLDLPGFFAAVKQREALGHRMNLFHREWDLLLTPTIPITAFAAGRETPNGVAGERWTGWTPFTYPFNLTRQPAATVPCGFDRDGMPIGLQIVGRLYEDALVLRAARAFEQAQPFAMPRL
jgi:aspartyl-tRNA(Asn)/glutamyl-tRNA(Gln) amidotransferase subunit A